MTPPLRTAYLACLAAVNDMLRANRPVSPMLQVFHDRPAGLELTCQLSIRALQSGRAADKQKLASIVTSLLEYRPGASDDADAILSTFGRAAVVVHVSPATAVGSAVLGRDELLEPMPVQPESQIQPDPEAAEAVMVMLHEAGFSTNITCPIVGQGKLRRAALRPLHLG